MNYCRRCGQTLTSTGKDEFRCTNNHLIFADPSPTVSLFFVDNDNNIMLAVRGEEPGKGMLDAFGGFLNQSESLEAGLERELREELALEPSEYTTPTYFASASASHNFGSEIKPVISACFWSKLLTDRQLTPSDDVADIKIMPIDDIRSDDFGGEDIKTAFEKLKTILLA